MVAAFAPLEVSAIELFRLAAETQKNFHLLLCLFQCCLADPCELDAALEALE